MSNPGSAREDARLREACDWLQRLNESHEQAILEQWLHWCELDPLNFSAFEQMQRTWHALPRAVHTSTPSPRIVAQPKLRKHAFALAASILILSGLAGWVGALYFNPRILETAVGEQRQTTLADGSQLDLAPDSRVRIRSSFGQRSVQLERGQAFFQIPPGDLRPFTVRASNIAVTAVGSAFDVRIDPSSTEVAVREGRIKVVSAKLDPDGASITDVDSVQADIGQRVTYSRSAARPLSLASVDARLVGAWRDGKLQFLGEPLENVIGVINRYGSPRIAVSPSFQQVRFTGTVSPAHVRDWLKALEQIYAVEMVDKGATGIFLEARADSGA